MQFNVVSLKSMQAVHRCYLKSQYVDTWQCCYINMNCSDRLWELCTFLRYVAGLLDDTAEILLLSDSYLMAAVSIVNSNFLNSLRCSFCGAHESKKLSVSRSLECCFCEYVEIAATVMYFKAVLKKKRTQAAENMYCCYGLPNLRQLSSKLCLI